MPIALGVLWMYRQWRTAGFVALGATLLVMFSNIYPILEFRSRYSGEKEYALWVKERTTEDALVVVMDDAPFIRYYGERETSLHPIGDREATAAWIREIDRVARSGRPVFLMESGLTYDPGGLVRRGLVERLTIEEVGRHLTEDYHHNSIRSGRYHQRLFQLRPRPAS